MAAPLARPHAARRRARRRCRGRRRRRRARRPLRRASRSTGELRRSPAASRARRATPSCARSSTSSRGRSTSDYELAFRHVGGRKRAFVLVLTDLLERVGRAAARWRRCRLLARGTPSRWPSAADPDLDAARARPSPDAPVDVYRAARGGSRCSTRARASPRDCGTAGRRSSRRRPTGSRAPASRHICERRLALVRSSAPAPERRAPRRSRRARRRRSGRSRGPLRRA